MSLHYPETLTIPSPIDVHAHLREPGGYDKETMASGTAAALSGGYQAVFDMPNNPAGRQTWSMDRLRKKHEIAEVSAYTNIGFYAGVDLENPDLAELGQMVGAAAGLKVYFGHTTGNTEEYVLDHARPAIDEWIGRGRLLSGAPGQAEQPKPPILIHAREGVGEEVADYVASRDWPVHWCHVSTATEVTSSIRLGDKYPDRFTAGVTPHHLTMTVRDADFKYGWNAGRMMPPLGKDLDQFALLSAFNDGSIQILETDHAPHTAEDKLKAESENPEGKDDSNCVTCFGVSGIEFVLPVMMSLVKRNKITMERLVDALHTQPARMLGLNPRANKSQTTMEVAPYVISERDRVSKSANNPYVGWMAWAKVTQVVIDDRVRYKKGKYSSKFSSRILRAGENI